MNFIAEKISVPTRDVSSNRVRTTARWRWPKICGVLVLLAAGHASSLMAQATAPIRLTLWPNAATLDGAAAEIDTTKATDGLIAGRRVIRLTNISSPEIHVYLPPLDRRTGTAVIICPGGGFKILAMDLEGTEPAAWLNSVGITAVVLKYRTPTVGLNPDWLHPVQDAQRAISLVRGHAKEWGIDPDRVGLLGFSAGAVTAARAALAQDRRLYERADAADNVSCRPNFALLLYLGSIINPSRSKLRTDLEVSAGGPPVFVVQTTDDPVGCENSLLLYAAFKKAGLSAELHLYAEGGHGYGLRPDPALACTSWPDRARDWLKQKGMLPAKP